MPTTLLFVLTAIISLIAGIFSGLLGIGGGLVLVPLFHYVLKMDLHAAIGTSLAIIVPTALIGAYRHAAGGMLDWKIFVFSTIFAIVGGFIGSGISMNLDVDLLRKVFAVFLILIAIRMFFQ